MMAVDWAARKAFTSHFRGTQSFGHSCLGPRGERAAHSSCTPVTHWHVHLERCFLNSEGAQEQSVCCTTRRVRIARRVCAGELPFWIALTLRRSGGGVRRPSAKPGQPKESRTASTLLARGSLLVESTGFGSSQAED